MAYIGQKPADKALGASDITDGIISNAKLAQDIISAETELATAPADTDELLISDAGTLKRIDASLIGGGGKVLQVVSTALTSVTSTTSTSYVSTGLAASITPSATSSKVLIMAGGPVYNNIADKKLYGTIYRDSTDLGNGAMYVASNNASTFQANLFAAFLDSPSTTSSTTYTYYHKVDSGVTGYISIANYTSTITLIEIGA